MRSIKRLFSGIVAVTLICTALPIGANAAWKQDSVGWWYEEVIKNIEKYQNQK